MALTNVNSLSRRRLLEGAAAILGARQLQAAKSRISKAKLSAITDEIGKTQSDAIDFARQHRLELVDLRRVPETTKEFALLTEPELRRYASQLAAAKLKVSLLRTSLLDFDWGADQKRWNRRGEDFAAAIAAARILGADKIGVATGAVAGKFPPPKIAEALGDFVGTAESAKVRLAIESATEAELKPILDLLPSRAIGFSWEPWKAIERGPFSWVDGYRMLPKDRMLNVDVNAKSLGEPEKIRWKSVFETLQKDGYSGAVSLATGVPDDAFIEKADDAVRELMHIVGEL